MNNNFEEAVKITLGHEGGYVNDPLDPGGETKYGISKRSYPREDIKNLTKARATEIYKRDYWSVCGCDKMPFNIGAFVFDFAVNAGVTIACKTLQKALRVPQDGKLGKQTFTALALADTSVVMRSMVTSRILYYASLSGFQRYKTSWITRTIASLNFL